MLWHQDLASEVAARIFTTKWESSDVDQFLIAARSKTRDTLVQKLQRMQIALDSVQDLAGVRIDADLSLDEQTGLATEIATHFGAESQVKDIREHPHSGYRAVHVWLRLPAGRVEVQIRTLLQSAWANLYERLADWVGRGIRYDETHANAKVNEIVSALHEMARTVERVEQAHQAVLDFEETLAANLASGDVNTVTMAAESYAELARMKDHVESQRQRYAEAFTEALRTLEEMEVG